MRKFVLALSAVSVFASFTNSENKTIVLKDIDGTLLQSFPVIKTLKGEHVISFSVNATTVVTFHEDGNTTHINLIENGSSAATVMHQIQFKTAGIDFSSFLEGNVDVASVDGDGDKDKVRKRKPKYIFF